MPLYSHGRYTYYPCRDGGCELKGSRQIYTNSKSLDYCTNKLTSLRVFLILPVISVPRVLVPQRLCKPVKCTTLFFCFYFTIMQDNKSVHTPPSFTNEKRLNYWISFFNMRVLNFLYWSQSFSCDYIWSFDPGIFSEQFMRPGNLETGPPIEFICYTVTNTKKNFLIIFGYYELRGKFFNWEMGWKVKSIFGEIWG